MYQALYRKWRPQRFDDVIGQKHITDSLKTQVETGRLSHAYLFLGSRGTGKTTCARILAKAVNCENPQNGNPCCQCRACKGIAEGSFMDVVELDAASNNGVDNVRALRDEAVFSPADVKKRVYIIDEVHMLSTAAFNALLKILEEPPEHLMFIMCTTELQKVPATILSRCQRHSFRRVDLQTLTGYIEKISAAENISITPEAAELIASLAEGGVRDSLSMLDQCSSFGQIGTEEVYSAIGLAGNRRIEELFSYLINGETESALTLFNMLWKDGKDPAGILKELSTLVRDTLMLKVAPNSAGGLIYGGYDKAALRAFAADVTAGRLSYILETLQSSLVSMRDRPNPRITAEMALITCSAGIELRSEPVTPAVETKQRPQAVTPKPRVTQPVSGTESGQEKADIAQPSTNGAKPSETGNQDFLEAFFKLADTDLPGDNVNLKSPDKVRLAIDGDTLRLEVLSGMFVDRYRRPEVLEKISSVASAAAGRKITAVATAAKKEAPRGNIEDLKKFKEVVFTD